MTKFFILQIFRKDFFQQKLVRCRICWIIRMIINEKFYVVMMLADWWKYSNFAELLKISILKTNINVSLITDSHISN